jgi:hypothetical protein
MESFSNRDYPRVIVFVAGIVGDGKEFHQLLESWILGRIAQVVYEVQNFLSSYAARLGLPSCELPSPYIIEFTRPLLVESSRLPVNPSPESRIVEI